MKPKPSELLPIDWAGVELQFRAGIKPLRLIAKIFGCSHTAIQKQALKQGWIRDLKPKIHARADELVANAVATETVATPVATATRLSENETVEAGANAEVAIRLGQRGDIKRTRALCMRLIRELEQVVDVPEAYGLMAAALEALDDPTFSAARQLRDLAELVTSLPQRVKVLKDLADALHRLIGLEREAFGLDTAHGSDGRPMVTIRDFTGRGDPDSPSAGQESGS